MSNNTSTTQRLLGDIIREKSLSFIKWLLIILFALYAIIPLLWLSMTSLKTNSELLANPFSLPKIPQFQNYINAFQAAGIGHMLFNSLIIGIIATTLNVFLVAMISYALSRFQFKGKEVIFIMFSSAILVPLNALMVPYYFIINKLGLYNTYAGLIIVYTSIGLPISIFIVRGFMNTIPKELDEAACIDGCGFYSRFFRVILPLSKIGLVTAATLQFLVCWNEFIYAMLLTSSQTLHTIQLGIRYFTNQFTTDYVSMYAAIVISIVPSIIAYMCFQKQIIAGLTSGAVKG